MNFTDRISAQKFTLIVSLPSNDLDLAKAALDGGADAIKVHCNVWHRASGHSFGSYQENREFLKELICLCDDVPVGLMPGTDEAFITNEDRLELEEMGLSFTSAYQHHLPPFMMESRKLTNVVAIDYRYTDETLEAVRESQIQVMEASVMEGKDYGLPLEETDIRRYAEIVAKTGKPWVIPTQKYIQPTQVKDLHQAGCKAIMIGAVVFGQDPTPEELREAVRVYRQAVDAL